MERQLEVGAVALVGLDDEPLPARPLRAGADVGDVAADDEARPQARLGEDQHQHRRRGRLAVGAGDRERAGLGADRGEHPRAAQRRDAASARLVELDVLLGDRGAERHRVAPVDQRARVADVHVDTGDAEAVEDRRGP